MAGVDANFPGRKETRPCFRKGTGDRTRRTRLLVIWLGNKRQLPCEEKGVTIGSVFFGGEKMPGSTLR